MVLTIAELPQPPASTAAVIMAVTCGKRDFHRARKGPSSVGYPRVEANC